MPRQKKQNRHRSACTDLSKTERVLRAKTNKKEKRMQKRQERIERRLSQYEQEEQKQRIRIRTRNRCIKCGKKSPQPRDWCLHYRDSYGGDYGKVYFRKTCEKCVKNEEVRILSEFSQQNTLCVVSVYQVYSLGFCCDVSYIQLKLYSLAADHDNSEESDLFCECGSKAK